MSMFKFVFLKHAVHHDGHWYFGILLLQTTNHRYNQIPAFLH